MIRPQTTLRFTLFCLLLLFSKSIYGQQKLFQSSEKKKDASEGFVYQTLNLDTNVFQDILRSKSKFIELTIPYLGDELDVSLHSYELLTSDFKVTDSERNVIDYHPGLFYRGFIKETGGMVAFTFMKDEIIAILSTADGKDLNLGKPKSGLENEYVLYDAKLLKNPHNMECHAEELPEYAEQLSGIYEDIELYRADGCVNVYVEADHALFLNKGGITQTTDFILGLWNPVSTIFWNETIEVNISEVFVWSTSDPYSTSSAGTALDQFRSENSSFNGDLAHLMAYGGNNLGGVAWVDVLCSSNWAYAYSNINAWYSNFPSYSWSVNVVSHEMGHNLGSPHTHNCSWNGGALDNCYDVEGGCSPGPSPTNGGTIMSYCHLTSNGVNFNNGFGPQPSALINQKVNSAGCLGSCTVAGNPPFADFSWNVDFECAYGPGVVEFFDQSTDSPLTFFWSFPGGSPSTSTDQNPVVSYSTAGIYSATLEVTNAFGENETTQTDIFEIIDLPTAVFQANIVDKTVTFANLSFNSDFYFWEFGDGNFDSTTNPTHTYDTDGNYTVLLNASNSCGEDEFELGITISTEPEAQFSYTEGVGCAPHTVTFTNMSSDNTETFLWNFEGGNPSSSSDQDVIVTYEIAGIFDVSLEVSNQAGSDNITQNNIIEITEGPTADFDFNMDQSEVSFINNSINSESFEWSFGDGLSSDEENPSHTYTVDGDYFVTLTAFNECGTSQYSFEISVSSAPQALFTATETSGCAPHEITYTNLSSSNTETIYWTFDGGTPSSSTEEIVTVTYETAGTYDVSLEASNSVGTDIHLEFDAVNITGIPSVSFEYSIEATVASFDNLTLNADTYFWDFGDGTTSTEENPQHEYSTAGFHTVIMTAANECGDDTHIEVIEIAIAPVAILDFTLDSGCADLEVSYTSTSSNATSLIWTFEGGNPSTSSESNPTINYTAAGSYSVELIVSNDYGTDIITLDDAIIVTDVPNTEFNASVNVGDVTFTNTTTLGANYMWDFGDGNTSNEDSPSHNYPTSGEYLVTLQSENDCGNSTYTELITIIYEPNIAIQANLTETCLPATIMYSDMSLDAESIEWYFPGGEPEYSTESNPTVTYFNSGSYDVTLTATNDFGTSEVTFENYVEVIPEPTSDFNVSGSDLSFSMNFIGIGDEVDWEFGDGNSSDATNPDYTYITEGTYEITAMSSNLCGTASSNQTVLAYTAPTSNFSLEQNVICVDESITLVNQSSINTTDQKWIINGTEYSTKDLTISFEQPGSYDVSLIAINPLYSDTTVMNDAIIVIDVPTAGFDINQTFLNIQFENLSSFGESYAWDFGDGTSSDLAEPQMIYAEEGTYDVSLIVTNQCGEESINQQILAYTPPSANFSIDNTLLCVGEEVTLNNSSSDNITKLTWTVNGITYTEENPTISFTEVGEYNVELIVDNPLYSDTLSTESAIVVIDVAEANFDFDLNDLVLTTSNLTTGAQEYFWDFGDGNTNTEFEPSHTYEKEDFYTVTLTVTNKCGSTTREIAFNNFTQPISDFAFSNEIICVGDVVEFNNMSSANTLEYNWEFEGGSPSSSSDSNPIIQYNEVGTFNTILSVSNPAGTNTYTHAQQVVVIDKPTAQFSATSEVFDLSITDNSIGDFTTYLWDFGDGNTSTESTPNHTYTEEGDYTVSLTLSNQCGSDVMSQTVSIINLPVANFTIESINEYCVPAMVQFINTSSNNVDSYLWNFPGGNPSTSTDAEPVVMYTTAGSYDVSLEVSNDTGMDMMLQEAIVIVNDVPTADFTSAISGTNIVLSTQSERADSYQWYVDGDLVSQEANYTFTPEVNGVFEIIHITENNCGIAESSESVDVNIHPDASFSANGSVICATETVQYQAQFLDNLSYNWTFEGGTPSTSTEQSPIVTYNTQGIYGVTLNVVNVAGNSETVSEEFVTVQPLPFANYNITLLEDKLNTSISATNGESIVWMINGSAYSQNSVEHVFIASGNYDIQLTVTNECGSTVYSEELEVDLNEFDFDLIEIVPNPADQKITLLANSREIYTLKFRFYTIDGKYIDSGRFNNETREYNVSHLPQGIYIVSILNGSSVKNKKLVIAR